MKTIKDLRALIEPVVTGMGYEFVGCDFSQGRHRALLRIYIDGPSGVTIGQCSLVSRQISAALDVEDPMSGRYDLEVSSPGLDRPLFTREHFQRFVGKPVRLKLHEAKDNQRFFKGILESVEGDKITLKLEMSKTVILMFNEIERANLVPEI